MSHLEWKFSSEISPNFSPNNFLWFTSDDHRQNTDVVEVIKQPKFPHTRERNKINAHRTQPRSFYFRTRKSFLFSDDQVGDVNEKFEGQKPCAIRFRLIVDKLFHEKQKLSVSIADENRRAMPLEIHGKAKNFHVIKISRIGAHLLAICRLSTRLFVYK